MPSQQYTFNKVVDVSRLNEEIVNSTIVTALDYITMQDTTTYIYFKATLSAEDVTTLDNLIATHVNEPLLTEPPVLEIKQKHQSSDEDVPFVYATSRPMNHATYFCGRGDGGEGIVNRGTGPKAIFNMLSTDSEKEVSMAFNEDVYLKDGFIIAKDAPFGACVCIEVHHPLAGLVEIFGNQIPIFGSGWWPLDTEDRAFLPKGLIVKIRVCNSSGQDGEDAPANFKLAGRLELFRPKLVI